MEKSALEYCAIVHKTDNWQSIDEPLHTGSWDLC